MRSENNYSRVFLKPMAKYKNLVFDIGNVIVDIDYEVTVAEFQKLATVDFSKILSFSKQTSLFDWLETGKVTVAKFREELKKDLRPDITDNEIDLAWNSILISYPAAKIDLLRGLKNRYRTFALSNINELHVNAINEAARNLFGEKDFGSLFHKAYYSNEVGYRKPDKEIYEYVMKKEQLVPAETFFVDDKEENVATAKSLGWQAFQLKERDKLHELLASLNII